MKRKKVYKITAQQYVDLFNGFYLSIWKVGESKFDYYCGITNDIKQREKEHDAVFLYYVKAASGNEAKEIEAALHKEGYDTGEQLGNGADNFVFVYMYRKSKSTKQ